MINKQAIINRLDIKDFYSSELSSIRWNESRMGRALCPFHEDTRPSLSINSYTGQFKCFSCSKQGSIFDFFMMKHGVDYKTAFNALAEKTGLSAENKPQKTLTIKQIKELILDGHMKFYRMHTYKKGNPQFKKAIYKNGKGDKKGQFFTLVDKKNDLYVWGRQSEAVLYNQELLEQRLGEVVLYSESENDCDELSPLGFLAISAGGATAFTKDLAKALRGRDVIILPHHDEAGYKCRDKIAELLQGIAKSVKAVDMAKTWTTYLDSYEIEKGSDIADFCERYRNIHPQENLRQVIDKIITAAPECEPTLETLSGLVRLDTVVSKKVEWLWRGYIALGKLTIIDGDPGLGKSLTTIDLIARCSSHGLMPDGSKGLQGGAVLLTLEDGLDDTVVPRLEAAGGDKTKVVALQGVPDAAGNLHLPTVEDVEHIARACKEVTAKLVVIDPIMGYLGSVNSWKDQDVRRALAPLVRMAGELNVAVIIIRHLNKGTASQSMYRGGGSIGFIGIARVSLLIAKDPEDDNKRILAGIKSNLEPLPPSLSYVIENCGGIPKIAWGGVSSHTADALLAVPATPEERSALDEAKDFLLDVLSTGSTSAKEISKQAKEAGISEKTLNRAKKFLGVTSVKNQFGGGWEWSLHLEDGQESTKVVNKYNDHLRGSLTTFNEKDSSRAQQENVIKVLSVPGVTE